MAKSLSFLNDLLTRSNNLIFFLIPEYEENSVIDFKLDYVTENIETFIDGKRSDIINKKMNFLFPDVYDNGIFEILVACLTKEDFEISFQRELNLCGNKIWFECNAARYEDGLTVTCSEISKLKHTEQELRKSNRQLEFQNATLREAEIISKSASFRWNIKKNTWILSENMHKLFDLNPKTIREFKNGIFDLMTLADRDKIKAAIDLYQYDDHLETQFFKTTKNNNRKYFSLSGNFVPVAAGQMMLGVVKNITEAVENEKNLRQKNEELLHINAELDSFNHIASHDLQEPLRKIRMFISRVNDLGHEDLSEKAKTYLSKIETSADRMQKLIKQLLTYSRIGKVGVTFEKVNLQDVFKSTVQDLEETKTSQYTINQTNDLPIIEGVPFLIHQLFYNIITNAIKYQHPDRPLHLEISSTLITGNSKIPDDNSTEIDEMVELQFKDNGIGFKQEYVDKIFELFQRLHQKNEYSGTGIGLAICRKIVETHHGSISAIGMLDLGATFIVQLPLYQKLAI
ncbi:sensor histidine kinase [Aquimarina celericrescens]|uniref:histidine kinase n=1 Tax=Aquimarina celericrescens TaxID=1964542 RepID=A0ABW5B186_9FLAO|nr:hypothetical protein [Aquimarina celericrescens]